MTNNNYTLSSRASYYHALTTTYYSPTTHHLLPTQIFSSEFCGNADMPFDFFMSRYKEAYVLETLVSAIGLGSRPWLVL